MGRAYASFTMVTTSSGRRVVLVDSREWKLTPSLMDWCSWKLTCPGPATAGVTSHSTQLPVATDVVSASGPPVEAGLLAHVIPLSFHEFEVGITAGPSIVLLLANRRSLAL